jgi:cytoskeletal protein RodZ
MPGVGYAEVRDLVRERRPAANDSSLHGPSFLGLNDEPPGVPVEDRSLDYLYDYDEPRSGALRVVVALILVLGFALFLGYEWKQNPELHGTVMAEVSSLSARLHWPTPSSPSSSSAPKPSGQEQREGTVKTGPGPAPDQAMNTATPAPNAIAPTPNVNPPIGETVPSEGSRKAPAPEQKPSAAAKNPVKTEDASDEEANSSRQGEEEAAAPQRDAGDRLFTKGVNYLYGRGGSLKSCDQALTYLQSAANMGNAKARSQLGALYATGHCVALDRAKAYEWFSLAADTGNRNVWVERNRTMLWSQMSEDERQRAIHSR